MISITLLAHLHLPSSKHLEIPFLSVQTELLSFNCKQDQNDWCNALFPRKSLLAWTWDQQTDCESLAQEYCVAFYTALLPLCTTLLWSCSMLFRSGQFQCVLASFVCSFHESKSHISRLRTINFELVSLFVNLQAPGRWLWEALWPSASAPWSASSSFPSFWEKGRHRRRGWSEYWQDLGWVGSLLSNTLSNLLWSKVTSCHVLVTVDS